MTGTGKDLFAYASSGKPEGRSKPYLALNCAYYTRKMRSESQLFGHAPEGKKGFFEQANGGCGAVGWNGWNVTTDAGEITAFLMMALFHQGWQSHQVRVDVRVICATQKNLVELVPKGVVREDLYYRLNVLTLDLPPLRDCPQDIMPLTQLFVTRLPTSRACRVRNWPLT
ncbi:sigma 54-interacting transcriptional regulator [Escherichia coli]